MNASDSISNLSKNFYGLLMLSLFIFGILSGKAWAQSQDPNFKISTKRKGNAIHFYADNLNYTAYQCMITPRNLEILEEIPKEPLYFIIPAQTKKYFLFVLPLKSADAPPLRYVFQTALGDPDQSNPHENHVYLLPYQNSTKHKILQGYNGRFSHRRQYALDFKMKEGTPICAVREGIVIFVKEDSNEGGRKASFAPKANRLIVQHPDGTQAHYWHLKQEGCIVKLGQKVNAGEVIAYSGNTGWSTQPHLHFVVKRPIYMGAVSIPTKFITRGLKARLLKAWRKYKALHPR